MIMTETKITRKGKEFALKALQERRKNKPKKINNSSLPAGSAMYFYCETCGHVAETLPEDYSPGVNTPKQFCDECQALKDLGWL